MRVVLASAVLFVLSAAANAQSPGPTRYGAFSQRYGEPTWGLHGAATWGTYQGGLGQTGWQYNKTPQAYEASGSILYPNQANSSFDNPRTGGGLLKPQDTRLKGRDRP